VSATVEPRRRRSSKEVRDTILTFARTLFDENGYQSTTTAQIAKEAGVSERLIFSHFGTKAELFHAAVIAPFGAVIGTYIESSATSTKNAPLPDRIDYFTSGLYDLAREHRTALLTALEATSSTAHSPHDNVLDYLARLFQTTMTLSADEEFREDYDEQASLATFVGMVLGVALLDDLIFPAHFKRPSRRRLLAEMRKTTLIGVSRRGTSEDNDSASHRSPADPGADD
jgi:AcrR family transcriptional regulator